MFCFSVLVFSMCWKFRHMTASQVQKLPNEKNSIMNNFHSLFLSKLNKLIFWKFQTEIEQLYLKQCIFCTHIFYSFACNKLYYSSVKNRKTSTSPVCISSRDRGSACVEYYHVITLNTRTLTSWYRGLDYIVYQY